MTTGTNCSSHSGNGSSNTGSNTAVEAALAKVNYELPADHFIPPKEISLKYIVGDIIGDGNFAVVRKCRSRKTKSDFALKIIDKSKCQGKEDILVRFLSGRIQIHIALQCLSTIVLKKQKNLAKKKL